MSENNIQSIKTPYLNGKGYAEFTLTVPISRAEKERLKQLLAGFIELAIEQWESQEDQRTHEEG